MKEIDNILKNNKSIIVYYLLLSSLSWLAICNAKHMLLKINPLTLVFITSILNFSFLLFIIIYSSTNSKKNILNDLKKITSKEYLIFIGFAILFSCSKIFSSNLLKFHDVQTVKIHSFIISVFVSGLALYILEKKDLNINRIIGFIIMSIGGYMFTF
jgi:drug/metabolite transporter (DMT)-like permease|tara:strand:- start:116 stop:586 length:471 start_codon:yes stop_codon:yes gene_type:complete